ncbi:MAG: hypothetical protein ACRD2N_15375 [Vicinamibacterales bacterium]
MRSWSIDNWNFLERQVVTDPTKRRWSIAVMDILGQEGDPEMPGHLLEAQYQAGRYFTLVYSSTGAIQYERAYRSLQEATREYERLLAKVFDGTYDPSQPVFRADLED